MGVLQPDFGPEFMEKCPTEVTAQEVAAAREGPEEGRCSQGKRGVGELPPPLGSLHTLLPSPKRRYSLFPQDFLNIPSASLLRVVLFCCLP